MSALGSSDGRASLARRVWRGARWVLLAILVLYIATIIWRIPSFASEQKSKETVAFIVTRHLTLADVDGSNLPPRPDPKLADATVAGIDENGNGIRDDVELAIFKKYPNAPYTRSAELQYAMVEQLFLTSVFSHETWVAVAEADDRAYQCMGATIPRDDIQESLRRVEALAHEVDALVFNTDLRKEKKNRAMEYITSFGNKDNVFCDVDASVLTH